MVKILLDKYPKGTYKGQQTDGRYIDGYLYDNLRILARSIVKDMTFLGVIFSSTLEVGTGKSVLATQLGEAWSGIMKEMHNIDVPFTSKNIVWRPKELMERAFQVPKYSFILLDEWEDATYWSELGMTLRQFFRKCRQLNLFIMVIIPNWFQLNLSYAVSRSVFAIDVKFEKDFERGFFAFYSFAAKRKLYIEGKRTHNYFVVKPNFIGRFLDGYGVPEREYRQAKLQDLIKYEKEEPTQLTERQMNIKLFQQLHKNLKEIPVKRLAEGFEINKSTAFNWLNEDYTKKIGGPSLLELTYNSNLDSKEIIWDEEKVEEQPKEQEENEM